jgi:hypothetical protein
MQVVFDSYGCEQVYFVAPSADRLPAELDVVIKAVDPCNYREYWRKEMIALSAFTVYQRRL